MLVAIMLLLANCEYFFLFNGNMMPETFMHRFWPNGVVMHLSE